MPLGRRCAGGAVERNFVGPFGVLCSHGTTASPDVMSTPTEYSPAGREGGADEQSNGSSIACAVCKSARGLID
jgi:hypothetical protein